MSYYYRFTATVCLFKNFSMTCDEIHEREGSIQAIVVEQWYDDM